MRVVAVAGAKGGVGKTAAAVNLAMLSAEAGFRTLLWDLDPQGAATHCYRARARVKGGATRLLGGKRDLEAYVRHTDYDRLDLLPADPSFRVVDTILATRRWPDRVLRKLLHDPQEVRPGRGLPAAAGAHPRQPQSIQPRQRKQPYPLQRQRH